MLHNTMTAANSVLKAVKPLLDRKTNFWLEPYANGRERGYHISRIAGASVSFSEARGSDQIVVYAASGEHFNNHNTPDDETYHAAHYFAPDDAQGAAKFIAAYLHD